MPPSRSSAPSWPSPPSSSMAAAEVDERWRWALLERGVPQARGGESAEEQSQDESDSLLRRRAATRRDSLWFLAMVALVTGAVALVGTMAFALSTGADARRGPAASLRSAVSLLAGNSLSHSASSSSASSLFDHIAEEVEEIALSVSTSPSSTTASQGTLVQQTTTDIDLFVPTTEEEVTDAPVKEITDTSVTSVTAITATTATTVTAITATTASIITDTTITTVTTQTTISTVTTVSTINCPHCCRRERQPLTVVIPVFERDLCKMKLTAKSIVVHDPDRILGKVIICWVSKHSAGEYAKDLDEIRNTLSQHGEVEVVELIVPPDGQGWFVQQAAKLKIASKVQTDFYLVLDAKNALLRDVEKDSFFTPCNQGKIFGRYTMDEMPGLHKDWYFKSAGVLCQQPMDRGRWPASITPMTMHTSTVLDLLDTLHEPRAFGGCSGGLCDALGAGATEFTLYLVYVGRVSIMECIHDIEDRLGGAGNNELAVSVWQGEDGEGDQEGVQPRRGERRPDVLRRSGRRPRRFQWRLALLGAPRPLEGLRACECLP